jgi:macrodomain Ter protein organizer (MatP/YcbG family)
MSSNNASPAASALRQVQTFNGRLGAFRHQHSLETSVSLEDAFWNSLKEIGRERHMTLSDLVAAIDSQRQFGAAPSLLAKKRNAQACSLRAMN